MTKREKNSMKNGEKNSRSTALVVKHVRRNVAIGVLGVKNFGGYKLNTVM